MQQTTPSGQTAITYGIGLTNRSPRLDAVGVGVTVRVVDGSGTPVATETRNVTFIPANKTFYVGGSIESAANSQVAAIRASVRVRSGARRHLRLAPITRVSVAAEPPAGWRVTAHVRNPYRLALRELEATACAVILDSSGAIVGGSCGQAGFGVFGNNLPPRRGTAVERAGSGFAEVAARAASARMSIDPGWTVVRRQIPLDDELAFCGGQPVKPVNGVLSLGSKCVLNLGVAWLRGMKTAFLETSTDAGATWRRHPNGDLPVVRAGSVSGVAVTPCALGLGTGSYLFRIHGRDAAARKTKLLSGVFPYRAVITCGQ